MNTKTLNVVDKTRGTQASDIQEYIDLVDQLNTNVLASQTEVDKKADKSGYYSELRAGFSDYADVGDDMLVQLTGVEKYVTFDEDNNYTVDANDIEPYFYDSSESVTISNIKGYPCSENQLVEQNITAWNRFNTTFGTDTGGTRVDIKGEQNAYWGTRINTLHNLPANGNNKFLAIVKIFIPEGADVYLYVNETTAHDGNTIEKVTGTGAWVTHAWTGIYKHSNTPSFDIAIDSKTGTYFIVKYAVLINLTKENLTTKTINEIVSLKGYSSVDELGAHYNNLGKRQDPTKFGAYSFKLVSKNADETEESSAIINISDEKGVLGNRAVAKNITLYKDGTLTYVPLTDKGCDTVDVSLGVKRSVHDFIKEVDLYLKNKFNDFTW